MYHEVKNDLGQGSQDIQNGYLRLTVKVFKLFSVDCRPYNFDNFYKIGDNPR